MAPSTLILDAEAITRALQRLGDEILEHNPTPARFALVGIPLRGHELARRLADVVEQRQGRRPETGVVDVSMHRDDFKLRRSLPRVHATELPIRLEEYTLILVDDVVFTGRTCRAAMDAISSYGRPARIQFAVLVDRGHRELPIRPDYVGTCLTTDRHDLVKVRLQGVDDEPEGVRVETSAT
ncbi:MAG TPA: bifunctional pyr operon transcriptional regulator/uracil phosphoribosyltransferase PyrR [Chthoniobacterales bacterium]